ncbi:pentapeptide repeat-containing protein [Kitasatospora aureofaciens]|uniref:pentapeptide repeat-containing protein n=1 Tax=Kitasatospora aureofaciens TaxID=1894 RepID=UPI0033CCEB4E
MGATLSGLVLDNVLFENCRFDYATFAGVRTAGPVAFAGCGFTEAVFGTCDLGKAAFEACALRHTEFGPGRYQGLDLRGNDLTELRGVAGLAKVVIDRGQLAELAVALMGELEVTFRDELPASGK